jgi:hypothetical protein
MDSNQPEVATPEVKPAAVHYVTTPHWEKSVKKVIYLLNVTPDGKPLGYQPRVRRLTLPLIQNYARKIGAEIYEITERAFPAHPITYEKLQINRIAKEVGADWNIYIDMDALVSPEMFDVTVMLSKDTVCHNGRDMANMRWKYDKYFLRDGRHWGSCNWFTVGSDWCLDLWRPLDDIGPVEAISNINITIDEHNSGNCKTEHLIDDYTLSRNIARFGLKATTLIDICAGLGFKDPNGRGYNPFLWHIYTKTEEEKLSRMLSLLSTPNRAIIPDPRNPQQPLDMGWGLMDPVNANQLREEWGLARR